MSRWRAVEEVQQTPMPATHMLAVFGKRVAKDRGEILTINEKPFLIFTLNLYVVQGPVL